MKHRDDRIMEIIQEIKLLAVEYKDLTGKPLGVTGEVAEVMAASLLNMQLAEARSPGFDAMRGVERIQIKGRSCENGKIPKGRLGKLSSSTECDVVMLVLLDETTLEVWQIWEAPFQSVVARLQEIPGRAAARMQLSVRDYMKLPDAKCVWGSLASKCLSEENLNRMSHL